MNLELGSNPSRSTSILKRMRKFIRSKSLKSDKSSENSLRDENASDIIMCSKISSSDKIELDDTENILLQTKKNILAEHVTEKKKRKNFLRRFSLKPKKIKRKLHTHSTIKSSIKSSASLLDVGIHSPSSSGPKQDISFAPINRLPLSEKNAKAVSFGTPYGRAETPFNVGSNPADVASAPPLSMDAPQKDNQSPEMETPVIVPSAGNDTVSLSSRKPESSSVIRKVNSWHHPQAKRSKIITSPSLTACGVPPPCPLRKFEESSVSQSLNKSMSVSCASKCNVLSGCASLLPPRRPTRIRTNPNVTPTHGCGRRAISFQDRCPVEKNYVGSRLENPDSNRSKIVCSSPTPSVCYLKGETNSPRAFSNLGGRDNLIVTYCYKDPTEIPQTRPPTGNTAFKTLPSNSRCRPAEYSRRRYSSSSVTIVKRESNGGSKGVVSNCMKGGIGRQQNDSCEGQPLTGSQAPFCTGGESAAVPTTCWTCVPPAGATDFQCPVPNSGGSLKTPAISRIESNETKSVLVNNTIPSIACATGIELSDNRFSDGSLVKECPGKLFLSIMPVEEEDSGYVSREVPDSSSGKDFGICSEGRVEEVDPKSAGDVNYCSSPDSALNSCSTEESGNESMPLEEEGFQDPLEDDPLEEEEFQDPLEDDPLEEEGFQDPLEDDQDDHDRFAYRRGSVASCLRTSADDDIGFVSPHHSDSDLCDLKTETPEECEQDLAEALDIETTSVCSDELDDILDLSEKNISFLPDGISAVPENLEGLGSDTGIDCSANEFFDHSKDSSILNVSGEISFLPADLTSENESLSPKDEVYSSDDG